MDHQPKTKEFVKSLGQFFKRDLISIPLIKQYPHQLIGQRCGLKAATLELDTAAYPNIEYIAGNRLSVYPVNPMEQVEAVMKHIIDDITPLVALELKQQQRTKTRASSSSTGSQISTTGQQSQQQQQQQPNANKRAKLQQRVKMSEPWAQFVLANGKDSVRLALAYLYDITTAPSRDLLRLMAESCSNREHKNKLISLSKTDEIWEHWVCQNLRTLKSTLDEFSSCQISAKTLFSELHLQQPRQYSISSIKSNKRFRTEIIVVQHRFNQRRILDSLQVIKERERMHELEGTGPSGIPKSPQAGSIGPLQTHPTTVHVNHADNADGGSGSNDGTAGGARSLKSVRSLRPMSVFGTSPISSQQVKRVPSYSGALMSMYALSSMKSKQSLGSLKGRSMGNAAANTAADRQKTSASDRASSSASDSGKIQLAPYEGLCSSYLLNLQANDYIVCEFVENPRFTLKGNRERPIMMIGQDVGVFAFRTFWQQRSLEHDRAQMFYTLFKDLTPKKFGDMQLVCLSGNKCKFEDLFKKEISSATLNKILSSVTYINRANLHSLLDSAATKSQTSASDPNNTQLANTKLPIEAKELIELGNRIYKLLIESNGCIYTCCDPHMTQAIEILVVESIARNNTSLGRDKIMTLLPKWKGRRMNEQPLTNNKFLFTLENPFERAQIVQEIYDSIN